MSGLVTTTSPKSSATKAEAGGDCNPDPCTSESELYKKLENGVEAGCFGVLVTCVCSYWTSDDWAIGLGLWVTSIVMGGLALFVMSEHLDSMWAWLRRKIEICLESASGKMADKIVDGATVLALVAGPANVMLGVAVVVALVAVRLSSLLQVPFLLLVAILSAGLWKLGRHDDCEGKIPIAAKAAKPMIWIVGFLIVFSLTDVVWFGRFGECMEQAKANIDELIGIADRQSRRDRAIRQMGQGFKDFMESL